MQSGVFDWGENGTIIILSAALSRGSKVHFKTWHHNPFLTCSLRGWGPEWQRDSFQATWRVSGKMEIEFECWMRTVFCDPCLYSSPFKEKRKKMAFCCFCPSLVIKMIFSQCSQSRADSKCLKKSYDLENKRLLFTRMKGIRLNWSFHLSFPPAFIKWV